MRFKTDRCIVCDSPAQPTNLVSKYTPFVNENGTISYTDYWVCCDEHYEEAFSKYLDKDYSPKHTIEAGKPIAPGLRADLQAVMKQYIDQYGDCEVDEYIQNTIVPRFRQEQLDLVNKWKYDQAMAIIDAQAELRKRLEDEHNYQHDKSIAERAAKFDSEAEDLEKQLERDLAEIEAREELLREKPIPFDYRFDHTHIIGGSGQGKSSLIMHQFLKDLRDPRRPAIVILDPKGTMIEDLRQLDCFPPSGDAADNYWDKFALIDPTFVSSGSQYVRATEKGIRQKRPPADREQYYLPVAIRIFFERFRAY